MGRFGSTCTCKMPGKAKPSRCISRDGTEAGLPELATQSGAGLRQKLGIADVPSSEAPQVAASVPCSPEATRLYAEGLSKMRVYDALAARDLFEQAIKADPEPRLVSRRSGGGLGGTRI